MAVKRNVFGLMANLEKSGNGFVSSNHEHKKSEH